MRRRAAQKYTRKSSATDRRATYHIGSRRAESSARAIRDAFTEAGTHGLIYVNARHRNALNDVSETVRQKAFGGLAMFW